MRAYSWLVNMLAASSTVVHLQSLHHKASSTTSYAKTYGWSFLAHFLVQLGQKPMTCLKTYKFYKRPFSYIQYDSKVSWHGLVCVLSCSVACFDPEHVKQTLPQLKFHTLEESVCLPHLLHKEWVYHSPGIAIWLGFEILWVKRKTPDISSPLLIPLSFSFNFVVLCCLSLLCSLLSV